MESKPEVDALSVALNAVSDRWSLHVVRALALGAFRFTDVARETGAPRDVLSSRLNKLVEAASVERVPYGPTGARSGYRLTQKGRDLARVLLVLKRWGDTWRPDGVEPLVYVHRGCGHPFVAEVACQACQQILVDGGLDTGAGVGPLLAGDRPGP